jgi:intergrase/recombinase
LAIRVTVELMVLSAMNDKSYHERLASSVAKAARLLKDTVARLDRLIAESTEESGRAKATRALAHLYKLLQDLDPIGGRA